MKYIVLVPDGMADYPIDELEKKTPLDVARTPNMDFVAKEGTVGMVRTVPLHIPPASDVANLSILGYDPKEFYTGRGPLEAANLGIGLADEDVAFRCNLITAGKDTLTDYSAGHISTEEAVVLIELVNQKLGTKQIRFYPGVSYRHLMVARGARSRRMDKLKCTPPHDIINQSISKHLPRGEHAEDIIKLMRASEKILSANEVNKVRIDLSENPANMIWLWGQGTKPKMPSFKDKFGISGSVISAVDLIKGIGKVIGLNVVDVPGATGYYDTDYFAKAKYALDSLRVRDFVYVHVEAPDEAGHNGDLREKITAIERFDQLVVGTFLEMLKNNHDFRMLILPDHATPLSRRTHTDDKVCFAMYGSGVAAGGSLQFTEQEAAKSDLDIPRGHKLMDYFINQDTDALKK